VLTLKKNCLLNKLRTLYNCINSQLSWQIRGIAQWKSKLGAVTKHTNRNPTEI
jgi:hypothetical protein